MKAEKIHCPSCGWSAEPVHRVADVPSPVLRGWYCTHCNHFERAIGRERKLEVNDGTNTRR